MATISSLGITFDTNAGNKTVVATPALRDFIIIICANTGRTTAQFPTITDNNSDGRGTYTRITNADTTKGGSVDSMWVFVRNDFICSASSTTFTMAQSSDTGGGLQVFKATGMSIAGATSVRQSAKQQNQAAAGTPAPVFSVAPLTANSTLGAVFNGSNVATLTPRTSWTESQDVGFNGPVTGLETMFRNGGETATTQTWGSTSASAFASAVVELDISVPIIDPIGLNVDDMDYRIGPSIIRSNSW